VHYKGTFKKDGKTFDSSYDRGEPIEFKLAEGMLIKGWTEGIPGMRVGGKRKLSIPYAMAYGEHGRPPAIPAKADLNFEVELLDVK
jgi:FKBP-type peptidyl-prolyl cis-trans isomerase